MTWLQKIGNWLTQSISGVFQSVVKAPESLLNKATGAGLTGAEREANEFTSSMQEDSQAFSAEQAALQRDWSAQEAERARDWNEEMYEKYNSLQGKIAQAEQAGVNPIYAVTGNAVSPMQTGASAPSGASASSGSSGSVSPTGHGLTDLFGSIMGLMKMKSEIENTEADTKQKEAEAEQTSKETSWMDKLNDAQLKNIFASTDELESRLHVNDETANKLSAEANKFTQEGIRISKITDAEVKKAEADALIAEYESSVAKILTGDNVNTDDIISAASIWLGRLINLVIKK